ncbi:MAG: glycosyltransferase family 39 protein [Bacillota bacterium]
MTISMANEVAAIVTPPAKTETKRSLVSAYGAWGIMALGGVCMLSQYLSNRSLWLDEVLLASNVVTRSFAGLLQPLDYNQGAPIGFLMLQRVAVVLFGPSEYAMRLVPLAAGLIALPLMWGVARRLLSVPAALFALGLLAVSPSLIYYASEAKQYSVDLMVVLGVILAALRVLEQPGRMNRLLVYALLGAMGMYLSHPAVLALAGTGSALMAAEIRHSRRRPFLVLMAIAAGWTLLAILNYVLFLRHLSQNSYLQQYWAGGFMPWPVSMHSAVWLGRSMCQLFYSPGGLLLTQLAALAAVLGCVGLWQRSRPSLLLVASPGIVTLVAAMGHKYPFSERLILFVMPILYLLIAGGIESLWNVLQRYRILIAGLLAAGLIGPGMAMAARNVLHPRGREEIRPVLAYIASHARPGDRLYVYYAATPAFRYYRDQTGLSGMPIIQGAESRSDWLGYLEDLDQLKGLRRVWVVFSHVWFAEGVDEQRLFLMKLDGMGNRLDAKLATGASAYLYDLSEAKAGG